jgi:GNAT superfamily N-acetyltransferase
MRAAHHLPGEARTAETTQRMQVRIAHLLSTDPGGSWVAVNAENGEVVGLSQALVRDDPWVLSLLGVSPRCQDRGTGNALLEVSLAYGRDSPYGLILCSRDPRAARRYLRAGFDLHPSVAAWGRVQRARLRSSPRVREGTRADAGFAADLDRRLRGGAHGPDLELLLDDGCRFLVVPERGYVLTRKAKPVILAADDESAAVKLLHAALATAEPDETVEVNWISAHQQWALRVAVDVGLELHPGGPVMLRGFNGPPDAYLPSGGFG